MIYNKYAATTLLFVSLFGANNICFASSLPKKPTYTPAPFVGANLSFQDRKILDRSSGTSGTINLRVGAELTEYFSIEGRLGEGIKTGKKNTDNILLKQKTKSSFGFYGRAILPNKTSVKPYFIAGYSNIKGDYFLDNRKRSYESDGASYGLGFDWQLDQKFSFFEPVNLSIEYLQELDKDYLSSDALSIGFHWLIL